LRNFLLKNNLSMLHNRLIIIIIIHLMFYSFHNLFRVGADDAIVRVGDKPEDFCNTARKNSNIKGEAK